MAIPWCCGGCVGGAANAWLHLLVGDASNAKTRFHVDSVMHQPVALDLKWRTQPYHYHVDFRIPPNTFLCAFVYNCFGLNSRWLSILSNKLVPKISMRFPTSFTASSRRLHVCAGLQRRQFHASRCLRNAAQPSEAEVDRARAYCANLVRYCNQPQALRKANTNPEHTMRLHTSSKPSYLNPLAMHTLPSAPSTSTSPAWQTRQAPPPSG